MALMLLSADTAVFFKLIFIQTYGVFVVKIPTWNKIDFQNGLHILDPSTQMLKILKHMNF